MYGKYTMSVTILLDMVNDANNPEYSGQDCYVDK